MAKKHSNAIIEEQRRAREEFLKLKKMQNGEMETGPKPSEVAIVPKTLPEKLKNIWFHDKWYIIGTIALIVAVSIMVAQCVTREKYDLEVVIYSHTIVANANDDAIAEYLEQFCEDLDGNGEVNIQVINCSYNKDSGDPQYQMSMSQKMNAIIASDANALIFITDESAYNYLNNISENTTMFDGEPIILGDDFYKKCTVEDAFSFLPEGLRITCRNIDGKTISNDSKVKTFYEQSQKILKSVAERNPLEETKEESKTDNSTEKTETTEPQKENQ